MVAKEYPEAVKKYPEAAKRYPEAAKRYPEAAKRYPEAAKRYPEEADIGGVVAVSAATPPVGDEEPNFRLAPPPVLFGAYRSP